MAGLAGNTTANLIPSACHFGDLFRVTELCYETEIREKSRMI